MKSFEMVDYYLMCLEEAKTNMCVTCKEHLEQIKQDLEVLEIIKKKEVFIGELKYAFKNRKNDKEALHFYNWGKDAKLMLTMEELLKLKQWLEENE